MLAALTMVYDKESGVMRMLIIAPFAHHWIIVAKTVAAALAGIVQAALLLVLLAVLGFLSVKMNYPLLLAGILLTALSCAGIGILVAAFTRTLDNFAAIMNFVIFPVFFLSGALYPIENLPVALKLAAMLNPFTYAVDLLKHAMLAPMATASASELHVGLDVLVTAGFTLLAVGAGELALLARGGLRAFDPHLDRQARRLGLPLLRKEGSRQTPNRDRAVARSVMMPAGAVNVAVGQLFAARDAHAGDDAGEHERLPS